MKPEQESQASSHSKRGKQSEQIAAVDTDDFEELKNRGLNLRPLLRIIKRNVILITSITTVVGVTSLFAGFTTPRSYEGDFQLLVEPVDSRANLTDPSVLSRDQGASTNIGVDYPSLLQVLQSPGLLSGIAKQIQTRYPDVSYESLSKDLVVERIGTNSLDTTKIIEVSYQGQDPEKVQFILEEVSKGYLNYSLENQKTRISGGVQFIEDQLPRLQQQVNNLELQLQTLLQRYKLSDPASDSTELSKQLREIAAQKLDTQRQLQEQKRLYTSLQNQLGLASNEAFAASALSEDPRYQDLLGQLKKIESQIAVESARFKENSPSLQSLRQQQKSLSLLLNQEAQRILGQDLSSTVKNPKVLNFQNSTRLELIKQLVDTANQVEVLDVRNQELTQAQVKLEQQVEEFPTIIRQYNDLQRKLDVATKTLNQLSIQRETLQLEVAQKQAPWTIISEARIPRNAAGNPIAVPVDNTKQLAMQVIAGFLLGLGAAVVREKYRNVFYTTEDIQDATNLPILGVISFEKSLKQFSNSLAVAEPIEETEANYSHASQFLEAFNSLYVSIRFSASDPPVRSLVVSSAAPGDGKTTTALHLAQAAAVMGQRVLLVDANLRLPQLHNRLTLPNQQGLSNLLSQNLNHNDIIQRSPLQDNLFVLTAGQLLPDSTRLIASTRMQHLMMQFHAVFDLVIYDTPHLVGIADANFLVDNTDGILMVVALGKTKLSDVMQVVNGLNSLHLPILGVVANQVEKNINKSSGSRNRYYEQNYQVRPTDAKKSKILNKSFIDLSGSD